MRLRTATAALLLLPLLILAGCGDDDPAAPSTMDDLRAVFTADEAEISGAEDEITIRLIGVRFTSVTGYQITDESEEILAKFTEVYRLYPDHDYAVEAHTDSRGSQSYNQSFSQSRAEAVLEYLMENAGRPGNGVTATGFGETRPIATNETAEGRARNRRVDVVLRR